MFLKNSARSFRNLAEGVQMKPLTWGGKTSLCEFRLAKGSILPSHAHLHEQTGYLISGKIKFLAEDQTFEAGPGDSWCFRGNAVHSAEALEDSVVVEVFSPVRSEYLDPENR